MWYFCRQEAVNRSSFAVPLLGSGLSSELTIGLHAFLLWPLCVHAVWISTIWMGLYSVVVLVVQ